MTEESAGSESPGGPPRVFVSYTHDSDQHKALVLEFATFLRACGIDAELDQWSTDRRRDWYTWMIDLAKRADFIIVVASPTYRRVGDGDVAPAENRGSQSEVSLLREFLHRDRETWARKLLPVILPGRIPDDIPMFLQPYTADHYPVTEFTEAGVEDLLRMLTAQTAHPRPPLGPAVVLPPSSPVGGKPTVTATGTGSVEQSGGGQHAANTGVVAGDFIVGEPRREPR